MSQILSNAIGAFSSVVETLTASSGGPVGPTAGNINIFQGTGITTAGNPGTSTITISTNGTQTLNYTNVAASPYVVAATDTYISVNCSVIPITVQLPNAPATGRVYIIKDRTGNANVNNITVTTVGGVVNIDGAATFVMNTIFESIQVIFNGTAYEIF